MLPIALLYALVMPVPSPSPTPLCDRRLGVYQPQSDDPVPISTRPLIDPDSIRVVVHVWVDETGKLSRAQITNSSGNQRLDRAAIEAAKNSRYAPRILDCSAVPSDGYFVVTFQS